MKLLAGIGHATHVVGVGLVVLGLLAALLPGLTGAPVVILLGLV